MEEIFREDPETIIVERRYGFISGAIKECVKTTKRDKFTTTDAVDKIVINRILGFPIFFLSMWLLFQLTFVVGAIPVDLMDKAIVSLQRLITLTIPEGLLRDLLVDGIIGGVGNVAIFVPTILVLFLGISFLEDSGYMARAAFIMDRVMHTLGLHGKSFIPLLMGFGCNVPAIMATRMLESKRDRILTMLINPLMSCSARLPVYVLLSGAFFGRHQGTAIFSIYLLGIVLAIVIGRIFKKILFPGESAPFVMELPPYRMPTLKGTLMHMWERGSIYLKKMGGVILICSVVIWFLGTFPRNTEYKTKVERLENTYIGKMGKAIEPALKHLGFDWKLGVSLISGFVAKEVVVSTIGVLYHVEETGGNKGLRDTLASSGISPLVAYGFMVFVLTYTPCVASAVAVGRESGSFRWTALTIGYGLCLAWILSFTIYQGGRLLGWA